MHKILGDTLSFNTAAQSARDLESFFANATEPTIELDLCGVKYCDSAGLALLLESVRLSRKYKKQCRVVNPPLELMALGKFYGLEKMLGVELDNA